MAVIAMILNGTNLTRDHGIQAMPSVLLDEGVVQGFDDELEVTTNSVAKGMAIVEVTRSTLTPNEVFKIPVRVTAAEVIDTSGTGYVYIVIDEASVNDGSTNEEDGTAIATVEVGASLPTAPYVLLATLASGVITDARTFCRLSETVQENFLFYDEDAEATDAYVITVNGVTELVDGMLFAFKPATANDGACTLNVNGLGAKALKIRHDADPLTGDIEADSIIEVRYNATTDVFEIQTPSHTPPIEILLADQAEAEAGTDDEKYMSPLKVKQSIDYNANKAAYGTAGEDLDGSTTPLVLARVGENYYKRKYNIFSEGLDSRDIGAPNLANTAITWGDVDARTWIAMSFSHTDALADEITLVDFYTVLYDVGTPAGTFAIEVQTDNAGSPSGTVIANGTSDAVTANGVGSSGASVTFKKIVWSTPPVINSGQTYWLVFKRSVANDAANYLGTVRVNAGDCAGNVTKTYTASTLTWSAALATDLHGGFTFKKNYGGKIVKASSSDPVRFNVVGVTDADVLDTEEVYYYPESALVRFFSGLTEGERYFLGASGAFSTTRTLDTTPTANTPSIDAKIFEALSATEAVIQPKKMSIHYASGGNNLNGGSLDNVFVEAGFKPDTIEVWRFAAGGATAAERYMLYGDDPLALGTLNPLVTPTLITLSSVEENGAFFDIAGTSTNDFGYYIVFRQY